MNLFRKALILAHRYLGIALSLLVIMWFATGITMMYVGGMPRLTPQLRIERLPSVDFSRVRLTPAEAAEHASEARAGWRGGDPRVQLLTVMDRPAYRVGDVTVFADTGDVLDGLTVAQSRTIASRFMNLPERLIVPVGTLMHTDQWTIGQSRALPLHKVRVDDDLGTELYVQPSAGEVTTLTTRRGRALAWVSTIPHWLYFAGLRQHQRLWYRIVVWTSGAVCVLAIMGLILAVVQWRKTRPFQLAKAIPYAGWMRWHYITGAAFGIFTVTWAYSGLLSMEPFEWTNATGLELPGDVFTGGPVDLSKFEKRDPATWDEVFGGRAVKEMTFARIQDEHYYIVRLAPDDAAAAQQRERLHQPYDVTGLVEPDRVLVKADTLDIRREPFGTESLIARLKEAVPEAHIVESTLLSEYDSYYYSRARQTPLPVLRVKFDDPAETWVYVDPEMSQVLAEIHRLNRLERWLYNGLHSLDFAFWYNSRLWDVGMITLLLGGLVSSVLGLVMCVRRLQRGAARAASSLIHVPADRPSSTAPAVMSRGSQERV